MASAKIVELDESNTCKICDNALAKYSCPRCNILYCSLLCYRSQTHLECSENFYKENVMEELNLHPSNEEGKTKMIEILNRMHEKNKLPSEGDEDEIPDDHFDGDFSNFSQFVDIDDIDEATDSDDDHFVDITERLVGVNLDDAETVWDRLTEDERQDFVSFLKNEDLTKLIPSWEPWWLHSGNKIEEVDEEGVPLYQRKCPKIVPIKDFDKITSKAPAPSVRNNLVNILAAYAFTTRYLNGEHFEFCKEAVSYIVTVALVLKTNQNFEDYDMAIKSVEQEIINNESITTDQENIQTMHFDVEKILLGVNEQNRNFYVLCALSDIHKLMTASLKSEPECKEASSFTKKFPNDLFPSDKLVSADDIKKHLKKIEYYLSYSKDCLVE